MRERVFCAILAGLIVGPSIGQPPTVPPPPAGVVPSIEPPQPLRLTRQYQDLIPGLLEALRDPDAEVRQYAALALAGLGEEAIAPLSRALEDANKDVRTAAAYALGRMGFTAHTAIPAILRALKDDEASVRRAAAHAISRITTIEGGWQIPVMSPPMGGAGEASVNPTPAPALVPPPLPKLGPAVPARPIPPNGEGNSSPVKPK